MTIARITLAVALAASFASAQPQLLYDLKRPGIIGYGGYFPCTWDELWGGEARPAGDVDGDGYDDVIVVHAIYRFWLCSAPSFRYADTTVVSGRTHAALHTIPASTPGIGTAVRGVGDVDGDGCADLGVSGQPAAIVSGATGATLFALPDAFYITAAGDLDGDGFDDFYHMPHAVPRTVTARSGADGSVLRTFATNVTYVRRFGDRDGDGDPDALVTSNPANPVVTLDSGRTGSTLLAIPMPPTWRRPPFGAHTRHAGDADGDGIDDVIISGVVYSGATGTELWQATGDLAEPGGDLNSDGFDDIVDGANVRSGLDGSVIALFQNVFPAQGVGVGDFNRDGHPDCAFGTLPPLILRDQGGGCSVVTLQATPNAPLEWFRGAACAGSNGELPRIEFDGEARQATTLTAKLRGSQPLATAALHLGLPYDLPLDAFGAIGCSLYSAPFFVFPVTTDAAGRASVPLGLGPSVLPIGARVDLQWAAIDAGANSLGVHLTNALVLRVGL